MGKIDKLNENIETLRGYLNELIEKNENGPELLFISQQLDKLLVEYYTTMGKSGNSK